MSFLTSSQDATRTRQDGPGGDILQQDVGGVEEGL